MKLSSLIIFFVLLFTINSEAQLWVGGRLGGSSASITGVGLKGFQPDPKMYFNGGLASSFSFSRRFSLGFEMLYIGKGSSIKYDGNYQNYSGSIKLEQKLHYLALPLVLQFKIGDRDNFFHFDAGLVYNTLIGDKFSGDITVTETNGDVHNYLFTTSFMPVKTDMSYAFGVGLMANGITFDFRFESGLNEVYVVATDAPKIYNRVFLVSVGYMFNLL